MVNLDDIAQQLAAHFAALRDARKPLGYPTYAIEHPFGAPDVEALKTALSDYLQRQGRPKEAHWLSWVIIAAEVGYTFSGEEYWDTFDQEIPGWLGRGDRRQIRRWFKAFAREFGGYVPTGRWATHFSIIAWPIAHSVLPRDLQFHFARLVYDARYDLADAAQVGVVALGERLRKTGHHTRSSRFDSLIEQTGLIGQLVLGLRDEDVQSDVPRLQSATMARLVADVSRTRNARDWLNETRKVLRAARSRAATSLSPSAGNATGSQERGHPGRCALYGRHDDSGSWQLGVTLPNYSSIADQNNIDLKRSSAGTLTFIGESTRQPLRALLGLSGKERPLHAFPSTTSTGGVLAISEDADWANIFADHTRVGGGPRWLLRLQADGVARQIVGGHVRAGENYLLVCVERLDEQLARQINATEVPSLTKDVRTYEMFVPTRFDEQFDAALRKAGLGRVHSTIIEPVGLVPRLSSHDGTSVWLATEQPILSLRADSINAEFVVAVDDEVVNRFSGRRDGPALVGLDGLSLGKHRVEITTIVNAAHADESDKTELWLDVRPPRSWVNSDGQTYGFRLALAPDPGSIDDLLSDRASLKIVAPGGRTGSLYLDTYSSAGQHRDHVDLGPVPLPAKPTLLRARLAKLTQEPWSEKVHASPQLQLSLSLEELGVQSISFRHKVEPVRWTLSNGHGETQARLVDDLASDEAVETFGYAVSSPAERVMLDIDACHRGITVASPGMLLCARVRKKIYSLAVALAPRATNDFAALHVLPFLDASLLTVSKVPRLVALLRVWEGARWQGQLVSHRRTVVIEALFAALAAALCGDSWSGKWRRCRSDGNLDLSHVQREVGGSPGFAVRMRSTNFHHAVEDLPGDKAFEKWAIAYQVTDSLEDASVAFRLAFSPTDLQFDNPNQRADILAQVGSNSVLCRGAFLARLASDRLEQSLTGVGA